MYPAIPVLVKPVALGPLSGLGPLTGGGRAWLVVGDSGTARDGPGRDGATRPDPTTEPRMSVPPKPATATEPEFPHPSHRLDEVGALRALYRAVQNRILSGLIAALPIVLTFWIVYSLYKTLDDYLLQPAVDLVRYVLGSRGLSRDSIWWKYLSPPIAVVLVLSFLYGLGLFVRSRVLRAVDWVLLRVPVVNTIFKAVRNVFQSLGQQLQGDTGFKRVVLVDFPHPGSRALAFVTNTLRDANTDRTILCVCVLTGVVPPSGFTLFVPEENVTDVDWSMNQALQAILSGGITTPSAVHYFQGLKVPPAGPIVDSLGHPIEGRREPEDVAAG